MSDSILRKKSKKREFGQRRLSRSRDASRLLSTSTSGEDRFVISKSEQFNIIVHNVPELAVVEVEACMSTFASHFKRNDIHREPILLDDGNGSKLDVTHPMYKPLEMYVGDLASD